MERDEIVKAITALQRRGMSLRELARRSNVSQPSLSRLLNGKTYRFRRLQEQALIDTLRRENAA